MTHRHYTASWRRCRDCGSPAGDCGDYCDDCSDRLNGATDAALREVSCTCSTSFVPGNAHSPPERTLDRRCPIHGDTVPDYDRAYDEWRDAQMERDL